MDAEEEYDGCGDEGECEGCGVADAGKENSDGSEHQHLVRAM